MLTERELDILSRRAQGEDQNTIAKALKISQAAVSQFETNAHKKIIQARQMQETLKRMRVDIVETIAGKKVRYGGAQK